MTTNEEPTSWILNAGIDDSISSAQIDKLASALANAQASQLLAKESESNPYFKSTYANLAQVWASCRKALTINGLSVTQLLTQDQRGMMLISVLLHSSGQWMKSELLINPSKKDPQTIGSYITYMRRYALAAMVGVAPGDMEDDDGESAMVEDRALDILYKSFVDELDSKGIPDVRAGEYIDTLQDSQNVTRRAALEWIASNLKKVSVHYENWLKKKEGIA